MTPETSAGDAPPPLFQVATHKFVVLSFCSFGMYTVYWFYQNWKCLKADTGDDLNPVWRAILAPIWAYSLFRRIRTLAETRGVTPKFDATVLAAAYLLLSLLAGLPYPWWLLSLASILPAIPVQRAAERINGLQSARGPDAANGNYTGANLATILIGGVVVLLLAMGSLLPE